MKQIALVPILLLILAVFSMFSPAVTMQAQNALLLYTRRDEATGINSLYVRNVATGEQKPITDSQSIYRAGWSPDGRLWVAESVSYDDDTGRFRFLDVETGEETILSENFVHNVDQCYPALLWSPDGQSFAYVTATGDERLLHVHHLTNESSFSVPFAGGEYLADWSDDGMYLSTDAGIKQRLLVAANGSEILVGEDIQFSPDARFVAYREDEVIWLYEVATGKRLNLEISGIIIAWFPAFMLIREDKGILWRYDMATGKLMSLEITGGVAGHSPGQRYLVLNDYRYTFNALYFYDTQSQHLKPIEPGYPVRFAGWTEDENRILLYADFKNNERQTLLRYDLDSGDTETVFEISGTLWSIETQGDWWFIRYSPGVGDAAAGAKFLLRHRETGAAFEVAMYYDSYPPDYFISMSPDRRWLGLNAEDGFYLFDLSSAASEPVLVIPTADLNYGVSTAWSGDSRYLVFNAGDLLYLWNTESRSAEILPDGVFGVTAWNGSAQRYVMLCSGGGDGNA